jgi:hypothetical protein
MTERRHPTATLVALGLGPLGGVLGAVIGVIGAFAVVGWFLPWPEYDQLRYLPFAPAAVLVAGLLGTVAGRMRGVPRPATLVPGLVAVGTVSLLALLPTALFGQGWSFVAAIGIWAGTLLALLSAVAALVRRTRLGAWCLGVLGGFAITDAAVTVAVALHVRTLLLPSALWWFPYGLDLSTRRFAGASFEVNDYTVLFPHALLAVTAFTLSCVIAVCRTQDPEQ